MVIDDISMNGAIGSLISFNDMNMDDISMNGNRKMGHWFSQCMQEFFPNRWFTTVLLNPTRTYDKIYNI